MDDDSTYFSAGPPTPPAAGWQSGYGQPPYAQPPTTPTPYAQPPNAQTPYAQPGYAQPPGYAPQPATPWGAPGFGYPSAPPTNRRGWIIAAIVAVAVIVLGIVAAVVFFVHTTGAAKKTGTAYLTDLQTGQYDQAYALLCPGDQAAVTESQFDAAKALSHPVSFSTGAMTLHTAGGTEYATMAYTDSRNDGTGGSFVLLLIKNGGTWQVCHV